MSLPSRSAASLTTVLVRLGLLVVAVLAALAALAAVMLTRPATWFTWVWPVAAGCGVFVLIVGSAVIQQARRQPPLILAAPPPTAAPLPDAGQLQALTNTLAQLIELARAGAEILERQRAALDALHQARDTLPRSVAYDPLTGAITHTALMTRLATDVPFAVQHGRPLALLVCDIDDFREVNARHGHRFGDEVLCAVAERMRTRLAEGDLLARLGADRFAVVRVGADIPQVQSLAEQIRAAVNHAPLLVLDESNPLPGHQMELAVTLRVGVALCPDDGTTPEALLAAATEPLAREARPNALREEPAQTNAGQISYEAGGGAEPTTPIARAPDQIRRTDIPASQIGQPALPWPVSYIDTMMQKYTSIHALTAAMEAQEVTTVSAARTLAELAQETALLLGRSMEEARLVGLAALLHDVGNLGIPAAILQKPEPLTPEEWAFVREHPHLGERLLTSVGGVLAAIAPIIASQRERWDGLGYPAGLRGEAIPLGARIVAVCDVYGALIADRPYRLARAPAEALVELERNAGTQFDPDVVRAFITAATS